MVADPGRVAGGIARYDIRVRSYDDTGLDVYRSAGHRGLRHTSEGTARQDSVSVKGAWSGAWLGGVL